jgi:hypothetical protein
MILRSEKLDYIMLPTSPLPAGITGLGSDADSPASLIDTREFLSYCHSVAREHRGVVRSSYDAKYPRNFAAATLSLPDCSLSVVLNVHYPFLALATPLQEHDMEPQFIDLPSVADTFREFQRYTVLNPSELSTPITENVICALSEAERREIRYWKPEAIGEIIFNSWD